MGTAAWALVVSLVALVVAIAAAAFSRTQARAQQIANAPHVAGKYGTTKGERSLRLTFTGHQVRVATVSIISGPAELIGPPDGQASSRMVTLHEPVPDHGIDLPVRYRGNRQEGVVVLDVTMRGDGFGKARRRVSIRVTPPHIY